jgi:hypothetical protein
VAWDEIRTREREQDGKAMFFSEKGGSRTGSRRETHRNARA